MSLLIPSIEAQRALTIAQGVGAVMGGGKAMAKLVYAATADGDLASSIEAKAYIERAANAAH